MRTMKVLTVLGLLLAISVPASALTFRAPYASYVGEINLQFTFVGGDQATDGFELDGVTPVAGWTTAETVHMAIFNVDTIYGKHPVTGATITLWQPADEPGTGIVGLFYGLQDKAWTTEGLQVATFGDEMHLDVYETSDTAYGTAEALGAVLGWDADVPSSFTGLTGGAIGLSGDGKAIIDPTQSGAVSPVNLIAPEVSGNMYEQKTLLNLNGDSNGNTILDPFDDWDNGTSTAYLTWTGGDMFNTQVGTQQIFFGDILPTVADEIGTRTSMGVAAQAFEKTTTTYMTDRGWTIQADTNKGAVDMMAIPEPLTMIALFGGVAGLGGYIRKRRMA